jgi:hypothetical protein
MGSSAYAGIIEACVRSYLATQKDRGTAAAVAELKTHAEPIERAGGISRMRLIREVNDRLAEIRG